MVIGFIRKIAHIKYWASNLVHSQNQSVLTFSLLYLTGISVCKRKLWCNVITQFANTYNTKGNAPVISFSFSYILLAKRASGNDHYGWHEDEISPNTLQFLSERDDRSERALENYKKWNVTVNKRDVCIEVSQTRIFHYNPVARIVDIESYYDLHTSLKIYNWELIM